MPNNPAEVPLLTKADAEHIWNLLPVSKSDPEMHRALSLDALASGAAITKSAAAEEADRARIVELEEKISVYNKACADQTFPNTRDIPKIANKDAHIERLQNLMSHLIWVGTDPVRGGQFVYGNCDAVHFVHVMHRKIGRLETELAQARQALSGGSENG